MQNFEPTSVLPVLFGALVVLILFLMIVKRIFVNVGAREIAIKERRYLGAKMPPGRVVATEGEVGIQADVLKPGLHLIKFPFEKVVRKVPLIEIGADGRWSTPVRVLERDHHLSYPFLFEHEGVLYMVPETAQAGTVELYRCTEFPLRWRRERVPTVHFVLDQDRLRLIGLTPIDAGEQLHLLRTVQ